MYLTFNIPSSASDILPFLTDSTKFVSVHPLIYKMIDLGQNQYKVYERVNIGFIPYTFTYMAIITGDSSKNKVHISANIAKLTKITMEFTLTPAVNSTKIEEKVLIQSFLPIKKMMYKLIARQHAILFQNIEEKLIKNA